MNFLWPAAWGFALLALPVIVFYLIRPRMQRRKVSTFLFWDQILIRVHQTPFWRKIRRWISLLLQLLFLFLLVFALTHPIPWWQEKHKKSVIIILDPSASMLAIEDGKSRWEHSIELASRRISSLRAFDEATIISGTGSPKVLHSWTSRKKDLKNALRKAAAGRLDYDLRPALALAHHLAHGRAHPEMMVFTDGVWSGEISPELLENVEIVALGRKENFNSGISTFSVRRSFSGPGEFTGWIQIHHNSSAPRQIEVEIRQNDRLHDLQTVHLEPGKPWSKTFEGRTQEAVQFKAMIRNSTADAMVVDDIAEVRLDAMTPVEVEMVSASSHPFLEAALDSLNQVAWNRRSPAEAGNQLHRSTAKLRIYNNSSPMPSEADKAVLLINPKGEGFWGREVGTMDQPLISEWKADSALLRFVSWDTIRFSNAREIQPPPGAEVLASSFGKPVVFGRWDDQQRWLVWPAELESSDLVFRTAFPILLGNIVQSLRQGDPEASSLLPGSSETQLECRLSNNQEASAMRKSSATFAWWTEFPLWWWAAFAALAWLLIEWRLYTRRITE